MKNRSRILTITLALAATLLSAAPSEAATWTHTNANSVLTYKPLGAGLVVIPANTTITMKCWQDAIGTDGRSHRTFYVTVNGGASEYREGFINSQYVSGQVTTPNCQRSTTPGVWAASWAISLADANSATYGNACLQFVNDAYKFTSGLNYASWANGSTSAQDAWTRATRTPGLAHGPSDPLYLTPPRGAWVFWGARPGYPYGHVTLSLGDGLTVSTLERNTTNIHYMGIIARNSTGPEYANSYLGWTLGSIP